MEYPDYNADLWSCFRNLEQALRRYTSDDQDAPDGRDPAIHWVKEMRRTLAEIVQTIVNQEYHLARSGRRIDTSDTMPCVMCNDHYPRAGEHVRGVQWEPVPGKGHIYICWECAMGLQEVLNRQINGLAYNLLFLRSKETAKLREGIPAMSRLGTNESAAETP